jgi:hypothetical protein
MIMSGTANAAILATGIGSALNLAECDVANIGTKPVMVKSVTIIDGGGRARSYGYELQLPRRGYLLSWSASSRCIPPRASATTYGV